MRVQSYSEASHVGPGAKEPPKGFWTPQKTKGERLSGLAGTGSSTTMARSEAVLFRRTVLSDVPEEVEPSSKNSKSAVSAMSSGETMSDQFVDSNQPPIGSARKPADAANLGVGAKIDWASLTPTHAGPSELGELGCMFCLSQGQFIIQPCGHALCLAHAYPAIQKAPIKRGQYVCAECNTTVLSLTEVRFAPSSTKLSITPLQTPRPSLSHGHRQRSMTQSELTSIPLSHRQPGVPELRLIGPTPSYRHGMAVPDIDETPRQRALFTTGSWRPANDDTPTRTTTHFNETRTWAAQQVGLEEAIAPPSSRGQLSSFDNSDESGINPSSSISNVEERTQLAIEKFSPPSLHGQELHTQDLAHQQFFPRLSQVLELPQLDNRDNASVPRIHRRQTVQAPPTNWVRDYGNVQGPGYGVSMAAVPGSYIPVSTHPYHQAQLRGSQWQDAVPQFHQLQNPSQSNTVRALSQFHNFPSVRHITSSDVRGIQDEYVTRIQRQMLLNQNTNTESQYDGEMQVNPVAAQGSSHAHTLPNQPSSHNTNLSSYQNVLGHMDPKGASSSYAPNRPSERDQQFRPTFTSSTLQYSSALGPALIKTGASEMSHLVPALSSEDVLRPVQPHSQGPSSLRPLVYQPDHQPFIEKYGNENSFRYLIGSGKMTIEDLSSMSNTPMNFQGTQRRPHCFAVVQIKMMGFSISKRTVSRLIGPYCQPLPAHISPPIHIVWDRITGKTGVVYVEFSSVAEAHALLYSPNGQPRELHHGGRGLLMELVDQEVLMKALFPLAVDVSRWVQGRPIVEKGSPSQPLIFRGFLHPEEISAHRGCIGTKFGYRNDPVAARPFEDIISILYKYPWQESHLVGLAEREEIFKLTLSRILELKMCLLTAEDTPSSLNLSLYSELVFAALNAEGFSDNQRAQVVFQSQVEGFAPPIISRLAPVWPFSCLGRHDKASESWLEQFAFIVAEAAANPTIPFGGVRVPLEGCVTMQEAGDREWGLVKDILMAFGRRIRQSR
ncbi:MAG: hypothetical protein M1814_001435 [Vezdaea aestivalis]|nr:MAG: hypothetical protein M1814_001435 [Vezdaea aestivalis]